MKPSKLIRYLQFEFTHRFNVLVVGPPGVGKTDVILKAAEGIGAEVVVDHPVVSDPTDFKGLPFAHKDRDGELEAVFLAYRNLKKAIVATSPTIYFFDDLGQASDAVQKAVMQLLLARQIGEHFVSPHVTFVAATNRKQDKAGVSGLLEPVKSRFTGGIIHYEVDTDDWVKWAMTDGEMPLELVAFVKAKPDILSNITPSLELENYASPRTIASVGKHMNVGLPKEFWDESFKGIAGQGFSTEFISFLDIMEKLPSLDQIIQNPTTASVPTDAAKLYLLCAGLSNRMNKPEHLDNIFTYLYRLNAEFRVFTVVDAARRHKTVFTNTPQYINWTQKDHREIITV